MFIQVTCRRNILLKLFPLSSNFLAEKRTVLLYTAIIKKAPENYSVAFLIKFIIRLGSKKMNI